MHIYISTGFLPIRMRIFRVQYFMLILGFQTSLIVILHDSLSFAIVILHKGTHNLLTFNHLQHIRIFVYERVHYLSRCGSGLSGETISDMGHFWIGLDISKAMLGKWKLL